VTLNNREQLIAWALGAGLAAVVLYYLVDGLWLSQRGALDKKITTLQTEVKKEGNILAAAKVDQTEFEKLRIQTLDSKVPDPSSTDRLVQTTFNNAGNNASMTFTSWTGAGIRPSAGNKDFMEAKYSATATTSTARLARFLQTIESATLPARIDEMTITTPKPGVDNLRVEFTISALLYMPKTPAATAPAATASRLETTSGPATGSRPAAGSRPGAGSRPAAATGASRPAATLPTSATRLSPAELDKLAQQMEERRRAEDAGAATRPPAPPATAKTPEEITAEMMARRAQQLGVTMAPETAPAMVPNPATSTSTAPGGTP
jgi:hypothetical protein